jgi:hypothetical protein
MIRQLTIVTGPTVQLTRDGGDGAILTFDARHDATIFDAHTAAALTLGEAVGRHRWLRHRADSTPGDLADAALVVYESTIAATAAGVGVDS